MKGPLFRLFLTLSVSLAILASPATSAFSTGTTQVHFIDVGQGDSILIRAEAGKTALIDGGSEGTGALQYLQGQGVQGLDLVVATHPRENHIGGLIEVLKAVPVAEVAANGRPATTSACRRFMEAITAANAQFREVRRGDTLQVGSLSLDVLNPVSNTGRNLNNQSVVVRMVSGQTTFLFEGDAEREAEESIISSGTELSANVLKVGHHASRTASSAAYLAKVKPQVPVYSAGVGDRYGHPHQETITAPSSIGADIYGTDQYGTVVITSDGAGYSVATSKGNNPRAPPVFGPALPVEDEPSAPDEGAPPADNPGQAEEPPAPPEDVQQPPDVSPGESSETPAIIPLDSVCGMIKHGSLRTLLSRESTR